MSRWKLKVLRSSSLSGKLSSTSPSREHPENNSAAEPDRQLFIESSKKFVDLLKRIQDISRKLHNTPADTAGAWGSYLLYRLCINGDTLVSLWQKKPELDHYAIAVLVRSMIETGIMLLYILEKDLSLDEWNLRREVLNLHDCIARIRLFKAVDDNDEADKGRDISEDLRTKIQKNPLYNTFDEQQQKRLLSGEVLFLRGLRGAVTNVGLTKEWFEVVYVTQSSFTHATPFSFQRTAEREIWKGNSGYAFYIAGFSVSALCQVIEIVIPRMQTHLESALASTKA